MAWDGRKGEPTMLNLPKRIYIKEVGPRDGLQIEKTFVPTATKIEMIDRLSQCGFADIQSAAFVHPKAVPNMADAEEVLAGITRQPGVEYSALVPNLRGFQRAAAAGVKRVGVDAFSHRLPQHQQYEHDDRTINQNDRAVPEQRA